jgi:predicted nuclease of restriction endonuclease-like RecB superfamily
LALPDRKSLPAGRTLLFPDFALVHRRDPQRVVLLEIVGFWTADYLAAKLAHLQHARVDNLILCLDVKRNCGPAELPAGAQVVEFRRRIDPRAVLAAVERVFR